MAVGTLEPNRYGLHDTHGNVWEWCRDRYEVGFYSQLGASGRNPYAPTTGVAARSEPRVMRGGGWKNYAEGCRSALRDYCTETEGRDDLGFRPVYNLER